jgi:uncharacterized protein YcbX
LYAGQNKILVNFSEECSIVEDVTIWGKTFKAGIENKSINEALSDFLSKSVKLVRYQSQSFRDLEEFATSAVKETTFTDSKPVLLANMGSLDDLNSKLVAKGAAPSVIERFRANIIVEGFSAMKAGLETEKRSMQRIWKEREKQIEKVIYNTIEMHASIRGIAGNAIQAVQALELPIDETDQDED